MKVEDFKQGQRAMWASGNFAAVAELSTGVAERLVERAGIAPGMRVLDVATGTGNVAIAAAAAGAEVIGLDLTPELLEQARGRALEAGLEVDWIEGDAEALPFDDVAFDAVLSTFGVMFAPRHRQAADELARVCRPGGTVGLCSWTPEGLFGRQFPITSSYLPPAPPFASPPPLWGSEEHVRELLEPAGFELELERDVLTFPFSAQELLAFVEKNIGPIVMAKALLEPQGRWDDLRRELAELHEPATRVQDGRAAIDYQYLRVIGRKGSTP